MNEVPSSPPRTAVTAIVLAGGLSSRIGSNKALLAWRERPFIEHIVERLRPQVEHIAISGGDAAYGALALPLLADPFAERRGPLAGILAGLRFSATPHVLITPCDNPLPAPDLRERLQAELLRNDAAIAYAHSGDTAHYLYALLRSDLAPALAQFLEQGDYAVRRWYATQRHCSVDFSDHPNHFININTAADLQRLPP